MAAVTQAWTHGFNGEVLFRWFVWLCPQTLPTNLILGQLWPMAKRAKKATKPLKDDVVRMRVTGEQKRALMDAAGHDGLELSAWLRQLALRAAGVLPDRRVGRRLAHLAGP